MEVHPQKTIWQYHSKVGEELLSDENASLLIDKSEVNKKGPLYPMRRYGGIAIDESEGRFAIGCKQGNIKIIERDGREVRLNCLTSRDITKLLFCSGNKLISGDSEGGLYRWNLENRRCKKMKGHKGQIRELLLHPADGKQFMAVSRNFVSSWSLEDGERQGSYDGKDGILGVIQHPDNGNPIIGDSSGGMYCFENFQLDKVDELYASEDDRECSAFAMGAGGEIIFGYESGEIFLHDPKSDELALVDFHNARVQGLQMINRRLVISRSRDNYAYIWDIKKQSILKKLEDVRGFYYDNDQGVLITNSTAGLVTKYNLKLVNAVCDWFLGKNPAFRSNECAGDKDSVGEEYAPLIVKIYSSLKKRASIKLESQDESAVDELPKDVQEALLRVIKIKKKDTCLVM